MKYLMTLLCALTMSFTAQASTKTLTLSDDNTLVLATSFNSRSAGELMKQARQMDANLKSGYPIYLFLYTPGGSIQDGLELIEFLTALNRPVHTITLFSASMGWQTVQHLGDRYILNYGVLMSHYARGGSSGTFGGTGMPSTKKSYDQLWERRIDMMDKKTVERTKGKQTIESYRKAYMFDLWLNGPEAVAQGYADAVVKVKCDTSLQGMNEIVEDFGFFRVKLSFSKCPTNQNPTIARAELLTNKGFMDLDKFLEQDGRFGKECLRDNDRQDNQDYYTSSSRNYYDDEKVTHTPAKKEKKLCAKDPKLTLKAIKDKVAERKAWHGRDLKSHIIYSY